MVAANGGHSNSLYSLHSLLVKNTRVTLGEELRDLIKSGYQEDSRWADIYSELQSAHDHVVTFGNRDYRYSHGLVEVKVDKEDRRSWKLLIPDVPEVKKRIMEELHSVPYSGHLGFHKTLKKIQQNFYWPDHTVEIRDFVLSCEVCQAEKSVHRLPAGLLQPL